jgi:hypothetical protein
MGVTMLNSNFYFVTRRGPCEVGTVAWRVLRLWVDVMDWIDLAQNREQWSALVNLRVPENSGNFLSSCTIGSFSSRAQLHEWVSEWVSEYKERWCYKNSFLGSFLDAPYAVCKIYPICIGIIEGINNNDNGNDIRSTCSEICNLPDGVWSTAWGYGVSALQRFTQT